MRISPFLPVESVYDYVATEGDQLGFVERRAGEGG